MATYAPNQYRRDREGCGRATTPESVQARVDAICCLEASLRKVRRHSEKRKIAYENISGRNSVHTGGQELKTSAQWMASKPREIADNNVNENNKINEGKLQPGTKPITS